MDIGYVDIAMSNGLLFWMSAFEKNHKNGPAISQKQYKVTHFP